MTLGDALTQIGSGPSGSNFSLSNGTFDTGNYSITTRTLLANAGVLNLGSSTVTITSQFNGCIRFTSSSALTVNAGTSQINITGASELFALR